MQPNSCERTFLSWAQQHTHIKSMHSQDTTKRNNAANYLRKNFPFSKLAGKKVNALIFPNLDSANSNYKMLKELEGVESIGPIMLGMKKPVHILQLGASVEEMVNMAAVAVVDAQQKEKRAREEARKKTSGI